MSTEPASSAVLVSLGVLLAKSASLVVRYWCTKLRVSTFRVREEGPADE